MRLSVFKNMNTGEIIGSATTETPKWLLSMIVHIQLLTWTNGPQSTPDKLGRIEEKRNTKKDAARHWRKIWGYSDRWTDLLSSKTDDLFSVCIFPPGRFVFTLHYYVVGQSTHPRKGFPYAFCLTASYKLVALCIVRQLHDNNNNSNKMSGVLTWCSGEVRCVIVRWTQWCRTQHTEQLWMNEWKRSATNALSNPAVQTP